MHSTEGMPLSVTQHWIAHTHCGHPRQTVPAAWYRSFEVLQLWTPRQESADHVQLWQHTTVDKFMDCVSTKG